MDKSIDQRYSLFFLLNGGGEGRYDSTQQQHEHHHADSATSSSAPASPSSYSFPAWSSSSPASRSANVSPTPSSSTSTTASSSLTPSRSSFQQDWGTSHPYYYHTYQPGPSTVDEVMVQLGDKMQMVKEKIQSSLAAQGGAFPQATRVAADLVERPRSPDEEGEVLVLDHSTSSPAYTTAPESGRRSYSLTAATTSPNLPFQSSFLYCKKKITRKQAKKRTPALRTVFYNCRVYEDGRQLHYTRDNKVLFSFELSASSEDVTITIILHLLNSLKETRTRHHAMKRVSSIGVGMTLEM